MLPSLIKLYDKVSNANIHMLHNSVRSQNVIVAVKMIIIMTML